MKKLYIQPVMIVQPMKVISNVCVGSVHGNSGVGFGGESDGSIDPA
ncbi:MAG: hypothetical protein J5688_03310 [Paludibacteraceae bacterium]|nr:hypothetical protein [Paludibacteraceae bacterium]